jgi:hypothetical protein
MTNKTTRRPLTPDDPRHGTLSGYKIHRCRCTPCRAANRDYNDRYNRLNAYGRWAPLVDAAPVRQHVNQLRAKGLGAARIAQLAGVGTATVQHLVWRHHSGRPPTKRLRPHVAQALLAVKADTSALADGAFVNAAGTRRRIQALAAFGWSIAEQARRLNRGIRNFNDLLTQQLVTVRTAREVAELYEQMSATPPPAGMVRTRTRRMAANREWAPPLAWDDDIDDPAATPHTGQPENTPEQDVDEVLVRRALIGDARFDDLNAAEQIALWHAWERQRRARLLDGPGLKDFATLHGLKTHVVEQLRNTATRSTAKTQPSTTNAAATGRTSERTAA